MLTKLFGVMTAAALLASIGVANAGERATLTRATLTDAQLDRVVAGGTAAALVAANNVNATASVVLLANDPTAFASVVATFVNNGPTPNTLVIEAVAN